jgi:cell division protein FtsW (lipid II flippase)
VSITIAAGTTVLLTAYVVAGLLLKISFLVAVLSAFAYVTWCWTLNDFQRLRLRSWLKTMPVLG